MECTICKNKIEEDCLFTRMCKKCTGQLALEEKIRKDFIEEMDRLWFAYGNAIRDCFEDKDIKTAKKRFKEFRGDYEKLVIADNIGDRK